MKPDTARLKIDFSKYTPEAVRYAAYSVSGAFYARLEPAAGGVAVSFSAKDGGPAAAALPAFRRALADEAARERIAEANRGLMASVAARCLSRNSAGLAATEAQKKEIDDLIAQIEKDSAVEAGGEDPLGITQTWEQRHEGESRRKKN